MIENAVTKEKMSEIIISSIYLKCLENSGAEEISEKDIEELLNRSDVMGVKENIGGKFHDRDFSELFDLSMTCNLKIIFLEKFQNFNKKLL